ncbi:MAG: hypothetical protein ABI333_11600 [bacterium]
MRRIGLVILAALLTACGPAEPIQNGNSYDAAMGPDGTQPQLDAAVADAYAGDGTTPILQDKVYAHSSSTLFEVDPNTFEVAVVAPFGWPAGYTGEQMTDIALDENGYMVGISFYHVFAVDKDTAECAHLAPLQAGLMGFNGLSYVEGVGIDPGVPTLVGVNQNGDYMIIDPVTGQSTSAGGYGGGFGSSGDLVYVRGAGAFATASHLSYGSDVLVQINPSNGAATVIGETGFQDIWGLAYWGGQVFGFTDGGQFLTIDITTGQGTLVESTGYQFWGAGVTTTAPIVR